MNKLDSLCIVVINLSRLATDEAEQFCRKSFQWYTEQRLSRDWQKNGVIELVGLSPNVPVEFDGLTMIVVTSYVLD